MFKSIILSFVIVLSVVNGNVSNSEKKKKNQLLRSNNKQHGNEHAGNLKVNSQLASSENVENRACSIDPKGPKLVILLSFGHSGSNEIWNIMGKFTGGNNYDFGFEKELSPTNVIEEIDAEGVFSGGKEWLLNYMCERQKAKRNAYFVGFKWKPKKYSQKEEDILKAIKSTNAPIKVIRLHRNGLDQLVSEEKTAILSRLGIQFRCRRGSDNCALLHKEVGTKIHVHTGSLIARLNERINKENLFDDALKQMNIPHVDVHFYNLLRHTDMGEWMQILEFLGKHKQVTVDDRDDSMKLASLSVNDLEKSISNYEFVKYILEGSQYHHLLY